MSKEFEYVAEFNKKILGIKERPIGVQSEDEYNLSRTQLLEEAEEFFTSCKKSDVIGCIDACIDSIFFSLGILYKLGVTKEQYTKCFKAVFESNMTKKLGTKSNRKGYSSADATKPEKFISPEEKIREILYKDVMYKGVLCK